MSSASPPYHAVESVFLIPELIEAILLHVDMTTSLVSGLRVSKSWNKLIGSSPPIQQALYFKSLPRASETDQINSWDFTSDEEDETRPILNTLLVEKFRTCFFDFGKTYGYTRRANSFYRLPWTARARKAALAGEDVLNDPSESTEIDSTTVEDEVKARRRFTRRGASWRRMLVSQPPPTTTDWLSIDGTAH